MGMLLIWFLLVTCPLLNHPDNGRKSCSLGGGDRVPHPNDVCTFTCDNDYQLMGSQMRTCQSDGSWSGNNATCISK